jgi:hypothetical protein
VYAMIGRGPDSADDARGRDIALPTRLIRRQSCGCDPQPGPVGSTGEAG